MAKIRLKKTSAKGHKWKKGQSCVSNPETHKHRQAARGCFFQRLDGNSNLTKAALAEHNELMLNDNPTKTAITNITPTTKPTVAFGKVSRQNLERKKKTCDMMVDSDEEEEEDEEVELELEEDESGEEAEERKEEEEDMTEMQREMAELGVDEDDLRSGCGKTFNTFASAFSTCTLPAFEKFFRTFDSASDQHTRMLGIHAAAQEYLRETNTPETTTAYYCSLMVTLEGVRDSEGDTAAALALMARVSRGVARDVLRAKFVQFAATLKATLDHYQESDNSRLMANALGSLSILLRAQDRAQWQHPSTLDLFNTLMAYTLHPKPKIRKAAQYNTSAILCGSSFILSETEEAGEKEDEENKNKNGMDEELEEEEGGGGGGGGKDKKTKEKKNKKKKDSKSLLKEEEEKDKEEENGIANTDSTINKTTTSDGKTTTTMVTSAAAAAPRHPAAASAAEFCLTNLRTSTELGNTKSALHTLVLLRQIIASLPRKQIKTLCEFLLSLLQVGRPLLSLSSLQALHSLLSSHPPPSLLPAQTNTALIHALTEGAVVEGGVGKAGVGRVRGGGGGAVVPVPGKNDPQLAAAWITVVTVAVMNLTRLDESEGLSQVQRWAWALLPYWQSDHATVRTKVRESLVVLVQECVGPAVVSGGHAEVVGVLWNVLCEGLSLQHQGAWGEVLKVVEEAFPALGPPHPALARPCLATLCGLMASPGVPQRGGLQRAVGAGVAALGAEELLSLVPVCATGEVKKDEAGWWVLPVLARHAQGGLAPFLHHLLPLAARCHALVPTLTPASLLTQAYGQVEQQVWAALPSFCREAGDGDEALARDGFARLLCEHIKHRPDTRTHVMAALRTLLALSSPPSRLATYSRNYLPALFNLYLTAPGQDGSTPGQRQAALATVRAFTVVLQAGSAGDLLALLLQRHTQAISTKGAEGALRRRALLDLAAALLPCLDGPALNTLYDHVTPLLAQAQQGQQKASYRLLECLLSLDTPAAQALLTSPRLEELGALLLGEGLASAAPSARAPRLRCLRLLLLRVGPGRGQAVLQRVVGEAVVCCGRAMSQATRRAAFLLVSEVGPALQRHGALTPQDTVTAALELLLAGLAGSPALASATMLALTSLAYQHRDYLTQDVVRVLVQNTCTLLLVPCREVVASCLSFIKALPALMAPPALAPHLPAIMTAMVNMTPDCQRKYRLKTRDILDRFMHRYGADTVAGLVPPGETILHKRIRNLRKIANRKQREREERRKMEEEIDDDEEDGMGGRTLPASLDEILAEIDSGEEEEEEQGGGKKGKMMMKKKSKRKGNTFIKEDDDEIVDLLDPSAGQSIMSGRAAAAAVERKAGSRGRGGSRGGFEVDKDSGKLIITEARKNGRADDDDDGVGGGAMDLREDMDELLGLKAAAAGGKVKKRKRTNSMGSQEEEEEGRRHGGGGAEKAKRRRADPGAEFRAKRAGGDVKRKGASVNPYAYVRLSKQQLNRRKKAKFEGQFGSLVRGARKGVAGGKKKGGRGKKK